MKVITTTDRFIHLIDITPIARRFWPLRLGMYFLFLASVSSLIHSVTLVLFYNFLRSPALLIGFDTIYCFLAFVGWKNRNILQAAVDNSCLAALFLLAGTSLASGTANWHALLKANEEALPDISANFFGQVICALAALVGIIGVILLRRAAMPGFQGSLPSFLKQITKSTGIKINLRPRNRGRGIFLTIIALLWLLLMDQVPLGSLNTQGHLPVVIYIQLQGIGFLLLIYARHYFEPNVDDVLAADQRRPILFLRSFSDDQNLFSDFFDKAFMDFSLESRLRENLSILGPFVAVGAPGDKRPHLGAFRVQLSNEEWQGLIIQRMNYSQIILMMVGTTHWVAWELKQIVNMGLTGKLVIVFPRVTRKRASERLALVCDAFVGTIWWLGLSRPMDAARIRSMSFDPDGRVHIVISKLSTRTSYQLGVLVALRLLRKMGGEA